MTNADKRTDMWRHALVMSLQTRGVPGDTIGDALADVDVHCADSGEDPWQAFGDPFDYANRVLGEPPIPARADAWRVGLAPGVMLAGALCLMAGVAAIGHGSTARLTVGSLVAIAVVLVAGFLVVRCQAPAGTRCVTVALGRPLHVRVRWMEHRAGRLRPGWTADLRLASRRIWGSALRSWVAPGRPHGRQGSRASSCLRPTHG